MKLHGNGMESIHEMPDPFEVSFTEEDGRGFEEDSG